MSTYSNNFQMVEAASGGFTLAATGTAYSKEYDVGGYAELKVTIKGTWTSQSGATLAVVLQMYDSTTDTWHDHATTFTTLANDGNEDKDFTSFASRVRIKATAGGSYGGSESIALVIGANGKGNT